MYHTIIIKVTLRTHTENTILGKAAVKEHQSIINQQIHHKSIIKSVSLVIEQSLCECAAKHRKGKSTLKSEVDAADKALPPSSEWFFGLCQRELDA